MTEPLHARELRTDTDGGGRGRSLGRYYGRCSEDCPFGDDLLISVTNAQSVINKPALVPAAVKVTAETAWDYLPRMVATSRQPAAGVPVDKGKPCEKRKVAERCGGCRFCVTAAIKAEHRNRWDDAADFGSLIHGMAHDHNTGAAGRYEPEAQPYVDHYLRFLDAMRVDWDRHIIASETTVLVRPSKTYPGHAGTGDIWLDLPLDAEGRYTPDNRTLWLVDIKTSRTAPVDRVYADQEIQLGGLRWSKRAVLVDDSEVPVPAFAGAAILNLRADGFAFIPLPSGQDAYKAFTGAVILQRHFHSQETKSWNPIDHPHIVHTPPTTKDA